MSLGIHIDKGKYNSIVEAVEAAATKLPNSTTFQIFTNGPRSKYKVKGTSDEELIKLCQKYKIYVHQTYQTSWTKDFEHMKEQYDLAAKIGAKGLVLHLGCMNPESHIKVLKCLNIVKNCPILLEMRALIPPTEEELKENKKWTYQYPQQINAMINEIKKEGFDQTEIGICLDTAHLSAGHQKINTTQEMADWIEMIEDWKYIVLAHVNGNIYDHLIRAGDCHCLPMSQNDKVFDKERTGCMELLKWHVIEEKKDAIIEVDLDSNSIKFINDFYLK